MSPGVRLPTTGDPPTGGSVRDRPVEWDYRRGMTSSHCPPPKSQPSASPRLRILSLGAGVQSTTVLLMALHDEFPHRPDCAIFADTGWEPQAVYDHLAWLETTAEAGGLPVYRVTAGNLKQDVLDSVARRRKRVANPPFFVRNRDEAGEYPTPDRGGMLWRNCTKEYKIDPIRRKLRTLAEGRVGSSRLPAGCIEQWFGISYDEWRRMRTSDVAYIVNHYPLVERRLTRRDCIQWLTRHGYRVPPKSACLGCPYHSTETWRRMKENQPAEWTETVAFDRAIRRGLPGVKGEAFVHRSLIPLDLVDLRAPSERGQQSLPGFDDECSGHCGV